MGLAFFVVLDITRLRQDGLRGEVIPQIPSLAPSLGRQGLSIGRFGLRGQREGGRGGVRGHFRSRRLTSMLVDG